MSTTKYSFPNSLFGVQGWDVLITNFAELADTHIHTRNQLILGETVSQYDALYLSTDGKWYKAKADGTRQPAWYLALQAGILNDEILGQRVGPITNAAWAFTVGKAVYLSIATAGGVTQTLPPYNRRQYLGMALTATSMLMAGSITGVGVFMTTTSTTTTSSTTTSSSTSTTTTSTSSTTTTTTSTTSSSSTTSSTASTTSTCSTVSTTSSTATTETGTTETTTTSTSSTTTTSTTTTTTSASDANLIPIMTADNAPSPYVASASTIRGAGWDAFKAFDHSTAANDNQWIAQINVTTGWLKIDLGVGNEAAVTNYSITNNTDGGYATACPSDWTFEGSNNDADWDTLDTVINETAWGSQEERNFTFSNVTAYRYYRLNITSNDGSVNWLIVGELELFA